MLSVGRKLFGWPGPSDGKGKLENDDMTTAMIQNATSKAQTAYHDIMAIGQHSAWYEKPTAMEQAAVKARAAHANPTVMELATAEARAAYDNVIRRMDRELATDIKRNPGLRAEIVRQARAKAAATFQIEMTLGTAMANLLPSSQASRPGKWNARDCVPVCVCPMRYTCSSHQTASVFHTAS